MHYKKFWKKLGFNGKYYAASCEFLAFSLLALVIAMICIYTILPYLTTPFHVAIAWIFSQFHYSPMDYQIKYLIRIVAYLNLGIVCYPALKIMADNFSKVIWPHLIGLNFFDDDL